VGGLQIRSISIYGAYYSNGLASGTTTVQPGLANGPSDFGGGAAVAFEWTKFTERSTFSLNYTPSYTARGRYSSLNALNHNMFLNLSRKLAPRWRFGFSAAADFSNLEQYLFSSSALSSVASTPASFNDLAAGLLSGNFANNPQLGVVLTNPPLAESPLRVLVYGARMLTTSAQASLAYSVSPRLTVSFTASGSRSQHISEPQGLDATVFYLVPTTTSAGANLDVSYSLSPVTKVGASVTTTRVFSWLQDFYTTQSVASWGRTLGRSLLVQMHGGVGVIQIVGRPRYGVPSKPRPVFGGSLAYKANDHTFLASFSQMASDSYGFGATTNSSADATWRWARYGRRWWTEAGFGWQQFNGNGVSSLSGWRTTVGINRQLTPRIGLLAQYTYLSYSGVPVAGGRLSAQNAARVTLTWTSRPDGPQ
jgi:hypothetical protein